MPPRPPWAAPGPPPAAPSLPRLGFAFFWHRLLWGFSPFLGSPWFPSDLMCACVELELYITPRGAGAEPWEGGMGAGGTTLALPCPGGSGDTPSPCMSLHSLPSCGPNVGAAGPWRGIWDYTPPLPSQHPLPALCAPPGHPTRPPHVTSRQVSSPQRDPRRGGGHGAARTPVVPPAMPPLLVLAACPPPPPHASIVIVCPCPSRTDGVLPHPVLCPPSPAPYLYPWSVLGVTCRCGSALSRDVCSQPPAPPPPQPPAPETVGDLP